jgi:putative DNA primase/helicase
MTTLTIPEITPDMSLVDIAHHLHQCGFHVFPTDHPDQSACIGLHSLCDGQRGKHPAVKFGTWAITPTDKMIDLAWAKHRGLANLGIACGPSGLVVLDEDKTGELERWAVTYGVTLPDTYTVTTGRGRHLYYHWDHDAQHIGLVPKAVDGFAMDVRGDGGLVIGEGSHHASGAVYTGNRLPVVPLPDKVAEILLAVQSRQPNRGSSSTNSESEGETFTTNPNISKIGFHERHNALISYAGRLRSKGLDYTEALPVFRQRWLLCEQPTGQISEATFHGTPPADCNYPVTWGEAEAKLADVYGRYAAGQPDGNDDGSAVAHSAHLGMAHKVAEQFRDKLLYVNGIGWHRWDGKRWAIDGDGGARRAVHAVIRREWIAAAKLPEEKRNERIKQIPRYETASAISGILTEAAALQAFSVTVADLDADPYLLNCANGTLDLRTMELRDASPADRITKVTRAAYDPTAIATAWTGFLDRVLPDLPVREYLQRVSGLALLGKVAEHILAILTGTGANGKGTFYKAACAALGDYASTVEPDLFMHREGAHPTGEMDLLGRRLVVVSESEHDRRLAEATMKRLTGGDKIRARRMRQDFVEFDPSHTPLLITNHLPKVSGDDPAIWRRIRVIPFNVEIPEVERDGFLDERLEAEADAVLTWAVAGWQEYRRGGLAEPDAVLVATGDYQKSSDAVARFIDEECHRAAKVSAGELFDAWDRWRKLDGADEMSKTAFGKALSRHGFTSSDSNGKRWWNGICILKSEEQ